MFSRIEGFRRLFDEGEEDTRQRFAEQQGIFSDYLPYAIVFGATKKWARAFEGLSAEQLGAASWYSGTGGINTFNAFALAAAIDNFDTRATGTLYASHAVVVERERVQRWRLLRRRRRRGRRRELVARSEGSAEVPRAKLPQMDTPATIADLFRAHIGERRRRTALRRRVVDAPRGARRDRARAPPSSSTASRPTRRSMSACCSTTSPSSGSRSARARCRGATLVGINPTRRGAELARDVQHTDCALLLTEPAHLDLLADAGAERGRRRPVVRRGRRRRQWTDATRAVRGRGAARCAASRRATRSC